MQLHFIIYFILLAREDLQQQEPSNTVLSYLFAPPARMEGTLKNYIQSEIYILSGPFSGKSEITGRIMAAKKK